MQVKRRTQTERTAATRAALVAAARARFGARGYAAVGTTEVAVAAGVSRGALYHQFADKAALFAAVVEEVEAELTERILGVIAGAGGDPVDALRAGAMAFLDAASEPEVRRILVLDGPVVLGWEGWRDLVARYGLGLTEAALAAAMEAGLLRPLAPRTAAHVLLGALNEAAQLVASSDDPRQARVEVEAVLDVLLAGLRDEGS